jgi:hypothetical protein
MGGTVPPVAQGLISVLVAGFLAVGGFLLARQWQVDSASYQRIAGPADCDLRAGPCRVTLPHGELAFSISPNDIPLMQTLTLEVETNVAGVEGVVVDIRGLNMDMGLNRTQLSAGGGGSWRGETILPICSQRRMEWEAAVQLAGPRAVEAPFPFATVR